MNALRWSTLQPQESWADVTVVVVCVLSSLLAQLTLSLSSQVLLPVQLFDAALCLALLLVGPRLPTRALVPLWVLHAFALGTVVYIAATVVETHTEATLLAVAGAGTLVVW